MKEWNTLIIVFGCLIINYLTYGMVTSFGLMFTEIIEHFETGKGETTWIPSLAFGMMLATGSVASIVERKFGIPLLTIIGGVTMTIGMVSSMFVPNMYVLYLTYGIISGTGFGLSIFAAQIIVTLHTDKRRAINVAIASTGSGIGRMTLPFITRYSITQYGWRSTFLILAGLCLQAVVVGFLFHLANNSKTDEQDPQNEVEKKTRWYQALKTWRFAVFVTATLLYTLAYLVPYIMLPSFTQDMGVGKQKGDWLITITGISGIIGRIIIGFIANQKKVKMIYLYGAVFILDGCISIGCAFVQIYSLLIVYSVFLGVFTGSYVVIKPLAALEVVGEQNLSIALGAVSLFQGFTMSVGPPIAGWIADATGRYDDAFFYRGGLYLVGGVMCFFIPFVAKRQQYTCNSARNGTVNTGITVLGKPGQDNLGYEQRRGNQCKAI